MGLDTATEMTVIWIARDFEATHTHTHTNTLPCRRFQHELRQFMLSSWISKELPLRAEKGISTLIRRKTPKIFTDSLRLLNALNSEDRGLKVRFSLATIAFDRESAHVSQILSSQGKNAPSNPYPHYLVRLATSRIVRKTCFLTIEWGSFLAFAVPKGPELTRILLDAALLLTIGGLLLTVELFYLQLTILAFCLQLELFLGDWFITTTGADASGAQYR